MNEMTPPVRDDARRWSSSARRGWRWPSGCSARRGTRSRKLVAPGGKLQPALLDANQYALHGFAWQATYVEALRQTLHWAQALQRRGAASARWRRRSCGWALPSISAQLGGGIPISQTEMVRPGDLGMPPRR